MQSWEVHVAEQVTDPTLYEPENVLDLSNIDGGAQQFNSATSDVEVLLDDAKETVRRQIGIYPNKMVISPDGFNALKRK